MISTVQGVHVRAEEVTLRYGRDSSLVLENLNLSLEPGMVTAIHGPSGCGKSTLLFVLGLMLRPTTGRIIFDGDCTDSLSDFRRSSVRSHQIGFVFQDAKLDTARSVVGNVLEPTAYRREARRHHRGRALELLELLEVSVPPSRRCFAISGGQAQRIAICRALLHNPGLVLADEPTGNLDPVSSGFVLSALRAQADGGGTVVIVTHSQEVIDFADRNVELAQVSET